MKPAGGNPPEPRAQVSVKVWSGDFSPTGVLSFTHHQVSVFVVLLVSQCRGLPGGTTARWLCSTRLQAPHLGVAEITVKAVISLSSPPSGPLASAFWESPVNLTPTLCVSTSQMRKVGLRRGSDLPILEVAGPGREAGCCPLHWPWRRGLDVAALWS